MIARIPAPSDLDSAARLALFRRTGLARDRSPEDSRMTVPRPPPGGSAPCGDGRERAVPAGRGAEAGAATWAALGIVAVVAVALRLSAAILLPNVVWPDEIHQTLEQAHRLVFGAGIVPWEFREGARSWLLPGVLAGAMELGRWGGPLAHVRAAQLLLCVLSLAPVAVAWAAAARVRGALAGLVAAAAAALWFELVLFAPKALAEVVAAHLLLLGLALEANAATGRRRLAAGALLGAAIALRVQLVPAVLVALAISAWRDRRSWRTLLPAVAVVVGLAGLLDLATWGRPFHSFLRTLQANLVEGKASAYGTTAWSGYLEAIAATWSWSAAVILPLAALGARRRPVFAACALVVLATHTAIEHKEYRFVYPSILLAITLAAIGAGEVVGWARERVRAPAAAIAAAVLLTWGVVSASRALRYETTVIDPASAAPESRWTHARWGLEAMALAGAKPDLCGVGLVLLPWWWTGGYAYLHRDVPIYPLQEEQDGPATAGAFNAVIAPAEVLPNLRGFTVRRCWPGGACLAEREGGCRSVRAETINARLVSRGE